MKPVRILICALAIASLLVPSYVSAQKPSHQSWNSLLTKYVTSSGKVNYEGMKQEQAKIKTYLKHLATTEPKADWSRNEKLAYWINLYNASTVNLIVNNYPLKSIMDLEKPWDKKIVAVGSKYYSLNQVENEIIRPKFNEPLIHFALNCAAKSCPKLLNKAYLPAQLKSQMEGQANKFLANTSKNKISSDKAQVSKIFEWYGEDFTKGSTLKEFLSKYGPATLNKSARISYMEYDWALNN